MCLNGTFKVNREPDNNQTGSELALKGLLFLDCEVEVLDISRNVLNLQMVSLRLIPLKVVQDSKNLAQADTQAAPSLVKSSKSSPPFIGEQIHTKVL